MSAHCMANTITILTQKILDLAEKNCLEQRHPKEEVNALQPYSKILDKTEKTC